MQKRLNHVNTLRMALGWAIMQQTRHAQPQNGGMARRRNRAALACSGRAGAKYSFWGFVTLMVFFKVFANMIAGLWDDGAGVDDVLDFLGEHVQEGASELTDALRGMHFEALRPAPEAPAVVTEASPPVIEGRGGQPPRAARPKYRKLTLPEQERPDLETGMPSFSSRFFFVISYRSRRRIQPSFVSASSG